jgi:hypothetical protein
MCPLCGISCICNLEENYKDIFNELTYKTITSKNTKDTISISKIKKKVDKLELLLPKILKALDHANDLLKDILKE